MDLRLLVPPAAVYLLGIIRTLRQVFQPQFDLPREMVSSLDIIDLNDQQVLTRLAILARSRAVTSTNW